MSFSTLSNLHLVDAQLIARWYVWEGVGDNYNPVFVCAYVRLCIVVAILLYEASVKGCQLNELQVSTFDTTTRCVSNAT